VIVNWPPNVIRCPHCGEGGDKQLHGDCGHRWELPERLPAYVPDAHHGGCDWPTAEEAPNGVAYCEWTARRGCIFGRCPRCGHSVWLTTPLLSQPPAGKLAPLGICDLCWQPIPPSLGPFTSKGRPRRYCSIACRVTANSRLGAPLRSLKAAQRAAAGLWRNPLGETPEEVAAALRERNRSADHRRKVAAARRREVEEGTWRNPALSETAREKLSRPRVHADDLVLHAAIEKLGRGLSVADLTPEEREAHRRYRRALRARDPERCRAASRRSYRRRMATPEGRARERARWRRQAERRKARAKPNLRLREARLRAGLTQAELARRLGVAQTAVSQWERLGTVPRDAAVRERARALLGDDVWRR